MQFHFLAGCKALCSSNNVSEVILKYKVRNRHFTSVSAEMCILNYIQRQLAKTVSEINYNIATC